MQRGNYIDKANIQNAKFKKQVDLQDTGGT